MSENFIQRYCFDADDMNSIYSNLMRAYDNGITLRESIGSETLSYIQLAVYELNKARFTVTAYRASKSHGQYPRVLGYCR